MNGDIKNKPMKSAHASGGGLVVAVRTPGFSFPFGFRCAVSLCPLVRPGGLTDGVGEGAAAAPESTSGCMIGRL